ncbi:MAG: metal-dependent hydrolase [bacterium]|nr:metal-dependent hydrolase [bacterium]
MKLTYLGHSAFEIVTKEHKILIDPFLVKCPNYNPDGVTDIFVTHAHGDHLGSAIEIAQKTGARITGIFELANYCAKFGVRTNGIGLGAWQDYGDFKFIAVPAFHSSSFSDGTYGGCPCGFVFEVAGHSFYHAGDTSLNSEMKVIGELYEPDAAMLPIGGTYTMDIEAAVQASEWLGVTAVIPMHYDTFDAIKVDISDFERQIREKGKMPVIMKIGVTGEI